MNSRFRGKEGKKRLFRALQNQRLISGNGSVAKDFLRVVQVLEYPSNKKIIEQGNDDTEIYFILSGSVNIFVNRRPVATRGPGEHIGEMALINPAAKRSATIKTLEKTIVGLVTEEAFTKLADKHPSLWRRIALELSDRLRQRSKFHSEPNKKPEIFIGSSKEALGVAKIIQGGIDSADYSIKIWTEGFFAPSSTTIESLMKIREAYDFGIIVFNGDDIITSRGIKTMGPRDNVVFELGLLMGALGRERTYIAKPKGLNLKIPSDLLGVTCYEFTPGNKREVSAIAEALMNKFAELGPR
jgi:CRP/FNR family cyclic AMP-dependent transcriptional regulator